MSIHGTKATIITAAQYAQATYAVDRNSNVWIFWAETESGFGEQNSVLWLDRDENEWENTIEAVGSENTEVTEITVPTPTGDLIDIEAVISPMSLCANRLDLEALSEGKIEWI